MADQDQFRQLWRKAMRGDEAALDGLLPAALRMHAGRSADHQACRMAARALVVHARKLRSQARLTAGGVASRLEQRARHYFCLAVAAAHLAEPLSRNSPAAGQDTQPRTAASVALDPVPDPPGYPIASSSGATSAQLTWITPNDHGSGISTYVMTATPANPLLPTVTAPPVIAPATGGSVPGLTTAATYTFSVVATNAFGSSSPSPLTNAVTVGTPPPGAPTGVNGAKNLGVLQVSWTAPAGTIISYYVAVYDQLNNLLQPPRTVVGTSTSFVLPAGSYKFGLRALGAGGYSPEQQSPVIVFAPTLNPFVPPILPPFSSDEVLPFDIPTDAAGQPVINPTLVRRIVTAAVEQGNKWRFEFLKEQALRAAERTLGYESLIAGLMQMTVAKASAAELLASPVLQQALTILGNDVQQLQDLSTSPDISDVVSSLGSAAATALLLEELLRFLIENDPLAFWVGLFNSMINDLANFDSSLSQTNNYLNGVFGTLGPGTIGQAMHDAAANLRLRLDAQVESFAAPLRAAVADIIGGTSAAMESVFQSLDLPLLMTTTSTGGPSVPNVNPFAQVQGQLQSAVESLINAIKNAIDTELGKVVSADVSLLQTITILYICLPILAFLVISVAGGPFGAAVLAAAVLIAAQELLHLLARWLAGPLLSKLNDAKQKVFDVAAQLHQILAREVTALRSPADNLNLVSHNLLELKELLPEDFVIEMADLLGEVRRAVLAAALETALAAERSLGVENGTAFDTIPVGYPPPRYNAPQLPGGGDASRLTGAALVRDISHLERQRIRLLDSKEMVFTERLSLFRLLGGAGDPTTAAATPGQFSTFTSNGQILLQLTEEALIDQKYPGVYRALISEIRPVGIFNASPGISSGIPLTITHLGTSRTRVKRSANPSAAPLSLPDCLPRTAADFVNELLDMAALTKIINAITADAVNTFAFPKVVPPNIPSLVAPRLVGPSISSQVGEVFLTRVPNAIASRAAELSCGLIETSGLQATARQILQAVPLTVSECIFTVHSYRGLIFSYSLNCPTRAQINNDLTALNLVQALTNGLPVAATAAYNAAVQQARIHIAKWGNTTLEEDRNPHIRSLGFATLVQSFGEESAVFSLLPNAAPAVGEVTALAPRQDAQPPVQAARTLQYRPFENRGIEGDLLLSLGNAADLTMLADVLLEIEVRACFDPDLAAAVKASHSQSSTQLGLADAVAAAVGKQLVLPGTTPELTNGPSGIRTIHLSARAHRDNLLRAALVAAEAVAANPMNPQSPVDGLTFDPTFLPLRSLDALRGVAAGALKSVSLQFQTTKPTSLGSLNSVIPVTGDDLSIPATLLMSDYGAIVGMGIAIIPTKAGITNGVQMQAFAVDPSLASLLPGVTLSTRFLTTPLGGAPVPLKNLWNITPPPAVTLTFYNPVNAIDPIEQRWIYDVIFSITIAAPLAATSTVLPAVA